MDYPNLFATKDDKGLDLVFELVRGLPWKADVQIIDTPSMQPVSLAGIAGLLMRVRANPNDEVAALELSLVNNRLVIVDEDNGVYGIRCTAEDTALFPRNLRARRKYFTDSVIERTPGQFEPGISAVAYVDPQITNPLNS